MDGDRVLVGLAFLWVGLGWVVISTWSLRRRRTFDAEHRDHFTKESERRAGTWPGSDASLRFLRVTSWGFAAIGGAVLIAALVQAIADQL